MIFVVVIVSVISFIIIQLPPGDWLTSYIARLRTSGAPVQEAQVEILKKQYGLEMPAYRQYLKWITGILKGNFGHSFTYNKTVNSLLAERLPVTITVSLFSIALSMALAIPIGIVSAVKQYSLLDYIFTFVSFLGLAIPNFLLALSVMFFGYKFFGLSIGGLWSAEFVGQPMNWAKFGNMLAHLPLPVIIIGMAGTASIMRVMRGCLLDELKKPYVTTARAKGKEEKRLILRYPVKLAFNPIISTIGWLLPVVFSGEIIVTIVFNIPSIGPMLFEALKSQDMYLAGSIVLIMSSLTVVGTFISDLFLVLNDPRIRMT